MTGILKGMGVSGGRLFLGSFFFGGTKKNEHARVLGTVPAFCPRRKKKYIAYVNSKFTRRNGSKGIIPWKSTYADVNGTFTKMHKMRQKKRTILLATVLFIHFIYLLLTTRRSTATTGTVIIAETTASGMPLATQMPTIIFTTLSSGILRTCAKSFA